MKSGKKSHRFFLADGNSLYPFFRSGDLFEISSDAKLTFGDLVVYKLGDTVFVHRFLFLFGGKLFLTSSYGKIEKIVPNALIGKVVRVRRGRSPFFRKLRGGALQVPVHFLYAQWVKLRSRL